MSEDIFDLFPGGIPTIHSEMTAAARAEGRLREIVDEAKNRCPSPEEFERMEPRVRHDLERFFATLGIDVRRQRARELDQGGGEEPPPPTDRDVLEDPE